MRYAAASTFVENKAKLVGAALNTTKDARIFFN